MSASPATAPEAAPEQAPAPSTPARRPQRGDIQGLRALAVAIVCLSHAKMPFFEGGYVGVDVFFVISGFLITGILMRSVARQGTFSIGEFYARRARRILPAAALVLVVVVLASSLTLGVVRLKQVLEDVVWSGLFAANIHFAKIDDNYFSSDSFLSPVRHYWSLAAEEQYYLVWPVLLLLVVHLVRRRTGKTGAPALKYVVWTLGVVTVLSLVLCVFQTRTNPTFAYYAPMTRAWELGAGSMLAVLEPRLRLLKWTTLNLLSLLGLGAITFATLTYSDHTSFPGTAAIVPVLGAALVIAGGCTPSPRGASRALDRRGLRWLGDISYSLYLWHWPFLVIPALAGLDLGPLDRVNLLLGAAAVAAVSHRWVEQPFRESAFLRTPRLRSLALWPAAAGIVLAAVFTAQQQVETTPTVASTLGPSPTPTARPTAGATATAPPPPSASDLVVSAVTASAARARKDAPVPTRLAPPLLDLDKDNWSLPRRCWADTHATRHDVCTFGDTSGSKTLVLLGDSHIGAWTSALAGPAARRGWRIQLFLKTGCPPIDVPMWRSENDRRFTECDSYRTWALHRIATLKPDLLAFTGFTGQALFDPASGRELRGDDGAAGTARYEAGMRRTLATLRGLAPHLVLIGDTNLLRSSSADCLGNRGARLGDCARRRNPMISARTAAWGRLTRAVGGRYVDLAPWLCARNTCPLVVGNTIVYFDDNHLTRTYATAVAPALADALGL